MSYNDRESHSQSDLQVVLVNFYDLICPLNLSRKDNSKWNIIKSKQNRKQKRIVKKRRRKRMRKGKSKKGTKRTIREAREMDITPRKEKQRSRRRKKEFVPMKENPDLLLMNENETIEFIRENPEYRVVEIEVKSMTYQFGDIEFSIPYYMDSSFKKIRNENVEKSTQNHSDVQIHLLKRFVESFTMSIDLTKREEGNSIYWTTVKELEDRLKIISEELSMSGCREEIVRMRVLRCDPCSRKRVNEINKKVKLNDENVDHELQKMLKREKRVKKDDWPIFGVPLSYGSVNWLETHITKRRHTKSADDNVSWRQREIRKLNVRRLKTLIPRKHSINKFFDNCGSMQKIPTQFENEHFIKFVNELSALKDKKIQHFSKDVEPLYYRVRHVMEVNNTTKITPKVYTQIQKLFPSLQSVPWTTFKNRMTRIEADNGELRSIQKLNNIKKRMEHEDRVDAYSLILNLNLKYGIKDQLQDSDSETRELLKTLQTTLKTKNSILGKEIKSRKKLEQENENRIMKGNDLQKKVDYLKKKLKRLKENPTVENQKEIIEKLRTDLKSDTLKRELKRELKKLTVDVVESTLCKVSEREYEIGRKRLIQVTKSLKSIVSGRTQKRHLEEMKMIHKLIPKEHEEAWKRVQDEWNVKDKLGNRPSCHDTFLMYRSIMKSNRSWDRMVAKLFKLTNGGVKLWKSNQFEKMINKYEFDSWEYKVEKLIPTKTHPDYVVEESSDDSDDDEVIS